MLKRTKSILKSAGKGALSDPHIQGFIERHPRLTRFIKNRLTPDERFGLYLTIGVIITGFFVYLFFGVVQDFFGNDPLIQSDLRLINLVQIFRTPQFTNVMLFFTYLGGWPIVFFGLALASVFFFLRKRWRYLFAMLFSVGCGEIFVWVLKNLIKRPRPPLVNALVHEPSYSFPSGHGFVALAFYGLTAYFLIRATKNRPLKILYGLCGFVIVFAIGFSRIYLGVHWPSDVLASYASGAAWLVALITALEIRRKFNHVDRHPYLARKYIVSFGILSFAIWVGFIFYYYQSHPLAVRAAAAESKIVIAAADIPDDIFRSLPRASETITGQPMEPIDVIIVATSEKLNAAFVSAGWLTPELISPASFWRMVKASILEEPYPTAPGTPSFWNKVPNEISFEQPTAKNSVSERHHLHLWEAPYILDDGREVWFGTAHFDQSLAETVYMIPVHSIDPAIDKERNKVRDDLSASGQVESIREFQIVEPTLGKNQAGSLFFTDGKAYVIFLK